MIRQDYRTTIINNIKAIRISTQIKIHIQQEMNTTVHNLEMKEGIKKDQVVVEIIKVHFIISNKAGHHVVIQVKDKVNSNSIKLIMIGGVIQDASRNLNLNMLVVGKVERKMED